MVTLLLGLWIQLPTAIANRFHRLLTTGQHARAMFYCRDMRVVETDTFQGVNFLKRKQGDLFPFQYLADTALRFESPTLLDLVLCRRRFRIIDADPLSDTVFIGEFHVRYYHIEYIGQD